MAYTEWWLVVGSVYALIHSIQSVVAFLGPVVHTAVFTATVKSLSSAVFIMSGCLLLAPLVLLAYDNSLSYIFDCLLSRDTI